MARPKSTFSDLRTNYGLRMKWIKKGYETTNMDGHWT